MTDKEKLDKLVAEIERLYHQSLVDENRQAEWGLSSAACTSYGKSKVCKELLSFTDSMQKEPKECMYSKDNYTDEDRKVLCDGCEEECEFNKKEEPANDNFEVEVKKLWMEINTGHSYSIVDSYNIFYGLCMDIVDWQKEQQNIIEPTGEEQVKESIISKHEDKMCQENGNSLTQEPVSELWHDSNKEQPKALSNVAIWDGESGEILTRCFKVNPNRKWAYMKDLLGKKEEPVSEELNTVAKEYANNVTDKIGYRLQLRRAVCFGAKWKEQQMMAKAVDATVHIDAGGYPYIPQMELYDYEKNIPFAKEGDKYKLILIKED